MLIRHNEDDLDKVFRQKLYNAEEEAPLHLWEGIRQNNKKKRRIFFMWWMLPVALLLGGAMVYALQRGTTSRPTLAQTIETKNGPTTSLSVNANEEETSSINETTANKEEKKNVQSIKNTTSNSSRNNQKQLEQKTTNAAHKRNTSSKSEVANHPKQSRVKTISPATFEVAMEKSTTSHAQERVDFPDVLSLQTNDALTLDSISKDRTIVTDELKQELETEVFTGGLPYVESIKQNYPQHWSIGAYYLLSQPIRVQRPNTIDDSFKAFADRTKPQLSHGFGLMASYNLAWDVQLSAGIEYQRFNEKHRWADSTLVQNKQYIFEYDTLITMDFTTITQNIEDSIITEQVITTSRERVNRYSSINIPVLLSWNYSINKYSIGLELGPVFRINSVYEGNFVFANWVNEPAETGFTNATGSISSTSKLQSYEMSTVNMYRNWRTDLHIGLQQSYRFSPRLAASLSLQTRIMMTDSRTSNEIVHRFIQPGVRVGLNYFIK